MGKEPRDKSVTQAGFAAGRQSIRIFVERVVESRNASCNPEPQPCRVWKRPGTDSRACRYHNYDWPAERKGLTEQRAPRDKSSAQDGFAVRLVLPHCFDGAPEKPASFHIFAARQERSMGPSYALRLICNQHVLERSSYVE